VQEMTKKSANQLQTSLEYLPSDKISGQLVGMSS